jgi:hypothetical protein
MGSQWGQKHFRLENCNIGPLVNIYGGSFWEDTCMIVEI